MKKSLRAKLTLILFIVGFLPLVSASIFLYLSVRNALFDTVFKELKWNINEIAFLIESYFDNTGKSLVMASRNTAFSMYFSDPLNRGHWLEEQQKTLKYLRSIYPDMLDEACFIESSGREVSRIVYDKMAADDELSSGEDRSIFFKEAFLLDEGEVYQGRPVISEDTGRFVLPNATPIFVNGRKAAILHFEIALVHFQTLLRKYINPDRGYGFIMNEKGEFIVHTAMDIGQDKPFPAAFDGNTPAALKNIYMQIIGGVSGIEQFSESGKDYYIIFRPVGAGFNKGKNENRWGVGYVVPKEKVYVQMAVIKYYFLVIGMTLILIIFLAYFTGNYVTRPIRELASATNRVKSGEMPKVDIRREDEIGQLSESFNLMVDAVKRRDEELKALASTDGLTGLYNHRYFMTELEKAVKSAQRYKRPLSLIMADVDNFKKFNDRYGHMEGDMALKSVAVVLMRNSREVDLSARYGGEEFVVMLPETCLDDAIKVAERIRSKMEEEIFTVNGDSIKITLSIGVSSFPENGADSNSFIDAADKALYKAKAGGRNQVVSG